MKHSCFSVVAALVLGVGVVGPFSGLQAAENPEPPTICRPIVVADPIDPKQACPEWRWVALKTDPDGSCPDPGPVAGERWKIQHLFTANVPKKNTANAAYALALPPALRPFCLYEYKVNRFQILKGLIKKLKRLQSGTPKLLENLTEGCSAVGPAAENAASSQALLRDLEANFLKQVGHVKPVLPLGPRGPGGQKEAKVRLSFIDTQPSGRLEQGTSQHGYALAQLARKLTCDKPWSKKPGDAECTAEIDYRLALPVEAFFRDDPEATKLNESDGGYTGSVDVLATAVWDAVRKSISEKHRVLNLSVGWNGERFGGLQEDVADMPVPVQAMYRALEVASCKGALVIAAAGNRRWGPDRELEEGSDPEVGPLLPAGWERRDAPTREACEAILGEKIKAKGCTLEEPLVYAAGGVRFDNTLLYNSRDGALPLRVAYANHALVRSPEQAVPKPMTGTSVATAVISAIASVVWHHWSDDLDRADLMELLYRASDPIGETAEFFHDSAGKEPKARRIALCQVLARACAELGGVCPSSCSDLPTRPPVWSPNTASCSRTIDVSRIDEVLPDTGFCGKEKKIFYDPAKKKPLNPCPAKQYHSATAMSWHESTLPQPEDDPCVGCGPGGGENQGNLRGISVERPGDVRSKGRSVRIEIDKNWEKPLLQASLDFGNNSLVLDVGWLDAGDCVLVENIELERFGYEGTEVPSEVIFQFLTYDQRTIFVPVPF